ncbi:hypothetical protein [Oharaeibacter diazotrophicus]|uniref:Tail assembly chaperone n=1 Tax=Oharaeibacter diazotrophicus TaxID=1920512 RepID=A0A4R6RGC8_9HYPH|nr:hypothetical protein [Oharaeibacter diazotrophicus]TDP85393.1 hypothetical protein EDD54_2246 [Oharaeibacter diazotrophicus]BBE74363.1 hypothetical protein OHA_1_03994 [Pleomorphomonas sp. SM30]
MPVVTVPLVAGASVSVRVLDAVAAHQVEAEATDLHRRIRDGADVLAAIGTDLPPVCGDGSDKGLGLYLEDYVLGRLAIVAWTGIGDEDGEPVDPTPTAIAAVMRDPALAKAIRDAATAPLHATIAEGKG